MGTPPEDGPKFLQARRISSSSSKKDQAPRENGVIMWAEKRPDVLTPRGDTGIQNYRLVFLNPFQWSNHSCGRVIRVLQDAEPTRKLGLFLK